MKTRGRSGRVAGKHTQCCSIGQVVLSESLWKAFVFAPKLGHKFKPTYSLCLGNTKSFYNLYSPLFNNLQQAAEESNRGRAQWSVSGMKRRGYRK